MRSGPGRKPKPTPALHPFVLDITAPGTCSRCHTVKANASHSAEALAAAQSAAHEAQAEERRRLGEED